MAKYLMQAVSGGVGGDGTLKAWSAGAADWAAAGFPGPGTAQHVAVRKVIRDDVLVTAGNGTELGRRVEWDGSIWAQKRGWITPDVDLTGTVDAAPAINTALASRHGVCVELPDGKIRVDSTIAVPEGATLTGGVPLGNNSGPFTFNNTIAAAGIAGATLHVKHTGVAMSLGQQARVVDLIGYYPDQETDAAPDAYDYFIQAPANSHTTTIQNIVCINPDKFIFIGQAGTPYAANGVRIDNVHAYPLRVGIRLGRCAGVASISNVFFGPGIDYRFGSTLTDWVKANGIACYIDGAEAFDFTCFSAYGYNGGIVFADLDGDGFRGVYGNIKGGTLDQCNACLRVDEPNGLNLSGVSIFGTTLIPAASGNAVLVGDTHTPASMSERPAIYMTDVNVHGPSATRAVWLVTGSYAICTWHGGSARDVTDLALAQSATSIISMDRVATASGVTRVSGAGSGSVQDKNAIVEGVAYGNSESEKLGANLTDADATITISGGAYRVLPPATLSTNRTVDIDNTGATDEEEIVIERQDTTANTLTIRDHSNATIFTFPASVKMKQRFKKVASANFVANGGSRTQ